MAHVYALKGLARLAESRGDYGSAKALAQKALTTAKETGLPPNSLAYLGWAALWLGETQEAVGRAAQ